MQTIRHLLCPVDLSARSAHALRYAAAFRALVNGTLSILHVSGTAPHQPDATRSSDPGLDAFVSDVVGPEPSTRLIKRHGEPVSEIIDTAVALAADVVVLGTHGRTGLQRLLMGSVAERVIRRSPVPVLTVPTGWRKDGPGAITIASVLCPVDFSEPSGLAVDYAASIVVATNARLVLVHVLEWAEEAERPPDTGRFLLPSSEDDAIAGMNTLLTDDRRIRCATDLVVSYGTPGEEVLRVVHERRVDLAVLGIRRRNPIDLALFGSTAQRLVRDGGCAVLTVRA